jgi:hypothetical protein
MKSIKGFSAPSSLKVKLADKKLFSNSHKERKSMIILFHTFFKY